MLQRSYYTPGNRRDIMRRTYRKGPIYDQKAPGAGTYGAVNNQTGVKAAVPIVCASHARHEISPNSGARRAATFLLPANAPAPQQRKTASPQAATRPSPPVMESPVSDPKQESRGLRDAEEALRRAEAEKAELVRMLAQMAARQDHQNEKEAREAPPCDDRDTRADCGTCGDCGPPDGEAPCSSLFEPIRYDDCANPYGEGLLYYQKFWYLNDVEISVRGEILCGTTLEFHENTLRLISDTHSYYIPLRQVDYIKTSDGLQTSFIDGRFGPVDPVRVCAAKKCGKPKGCGQREPDQKREPPDEKENANP